LRHRWQLRGNASRRTARSYPSVKIGAVEQKSRALVLVWNAAKVYEPVEARTRAGKVVRRILHAEPLRRRCGRLSRGDKIGCALGKLLDQLIRDYKRQTHVTAPFGVDARTRRLAGTPVTKREVLRVAAVADVAAL
jgi:hypothetical protein